MQQRIILAKKFIVPEEKFMKVSKIYSDLSEKVTGKKIDISTNPREEILDILLTYGIIN